MDERFIVSPEAFEGISFLVQRDVIHGKPVSGYYIRHPFLRRDGKTYNVCFYSEKAERATAVRARRGEDGEYVLIAKRCPAKYIVESFYIDRMVVTKHSFECNGKTVTRYYIDELDITFPEDNYTADYIHRKEI